MVLLIPDPSFRDYLIANPALTVSRLPLCALLRDSFVVESRFSV